MMIKKRTRDEFKILFNVQNLKKEDDKDQGCHLAFFETVF